MGHLLYFAYDHHMDESALRRTAPGTEPFGPSRLPGHALGLTATGDAEPVPRAGEVVWGMLWLVPAEHLASLDEAHGVNAGRRARDTVRIISPAGPPTQAICYLHSGNTKSGGNTLSPRDTNWPLLLSAAKQQRLPDDYRRGLARLAADAAKISR